MFVDIVFDGSHERVDITTKTGAIYTSSSSTAATCYEEVDMDGHSPDYCDPAKECMSAALCYVYSPTISFDLTGMCRYLSVISGS
jgi:hypothetical protein